MDIMLKRILASVVLFLMLTGAAAAGPFEEGKAAFQRGDYAAAEPYWPLANTHLPPAAARRMSA